MAGGEGCLKLLGYLRRMVCKIVNGRMSRTISVTRNRIAAAADTAFQWGVLQEGKGFFSSHCKGTGWGRSFVRNSRRNAFGYDAVRNLRAAVLKFVCKGSR